MALSKSKLAVLSALEKWKERDAHSISGCRKFWDGAIGEVWYLLDPIDYLLNEKKGEKLWKTKHRTK